MYIVEYTWLFVDASVYKNTDYPCEFQNVKHLG